MTFARLQGGAYTRLGRNLRERVWGTKSPCRFAAPPLTCGPAFGAPAGIQRFKYAPSSVTASPCHLPPSGGKACGRVWVPYGQIGTFRGGRVRAPAPMKYGELSGLSIGAGHWPTRRRPLAAHLIRHAPRDTPAPFVLRPFLPVRENRPSPLGEGAPEGGG